MADDDKGPDFPAPPATGTRELRELVGTIATVTLVDTSRPGKPRFTIGGKVYASDDPWADECAHAVSSYFRTSGADELRVQVVEEDGQVGMSAAPAE